MTDHLVLVLAFLGTTLILLATVMLVWIEFYGFLHGHPTSLVWKLVRGNVWLVRFYRDAVNKGWLRWPSYWYWVFLGGVVLATVAVFVEVLRSTP